MKTLKNVVGVVLIMFVSNIVFAQGLVTKVVTAEEQAKATSTEVANALGLTDTQKKAVHDAALQRAKSVAESNEKYKSNKIALEAATAKADKTYETAVTTVLTPEQKTKFEKMMKDKTKAKLKL